MKKVQRDWEEDVKDVYSESQVEAVLRFCDIEVDSETYSHFLAYCPFHGNTDTPALEIDKSKGLFYCFNPSCNITGGLEDLLRLTKGLNPFQATRVILKYKSSAIESFESRMKKALTKKPEFVEFPQEILDRTYSDFKGSVGESYMLGRHFTHETLDYFRIGYSAKQNMVVVPMHDPSGMPIGLIGRTATTDEKRFKNSLNLPKSLTAWNFHRAKQTGDTVIVCEASFDAMRIHQAGYPNVIALLGGHVTPHHLEQINRTFSTVIIMTDMDKKKFYPNCRKCNYRECSGHRPGRDLGRAIADGLQNKRVLWAVYSADMLFPMDPLAGYRDKPAKDASDMTDSEIRTCLRNAVSTYRYEAMGLENMVA